MSKKKTKSKRGCGKTTLLSLVILLIVIIIAGVGINKLLHSDKFSTEELSTISELLSQEYDKTQFESNTVTAADVALLKQKISDTSVLVSTRGVQMWPGEHLNLEVFKSSEVLFYNRLMLSGKDVACLINEILYHYRSQISVDNSELNNYIIYKMLTLCTVELSTDTTTGLTHVKMVVKVNLTDANSVLKDFGVLSSALKLDLPEYIYITVAGDINFNVVSTPPITNVSMRINNLNDADNTTVLKFFNKISSATTSENIENGMGSACIRLGITTLTQQLEVWRGQDAPQRVAAKFEGEYLYIGKF